MISARRTLLIARRDFLGYVKTWGFWLTALGPFFGIIFGVMAPMLMVKSEPVRYVTILDETGLHASGIEKKLDDRNERILVQAIEEAARFAVPRDQKEEFAAILAAEGSAGGIKFLKKQSPLIANRLDFERKLKFIPSPTADIADLKTRVKNKAKLPEAENNPLAGVLHIYDQDGMTKAEYWSVNPGDSGVPRLANQHFRTFTGQQFMAGHGLTSDQFYAARADAPKVDALNPAKTKSEEGGQKKSRRDLVPFMVSAALAALLWFSVFTGAYMLLMSMVEEKINKVLEMLLATTRFSEIFIGKLVGVGALTLAALLPWILLFGLGLFGAMQLGDGAMAAGLAKAVNWKMAVFLPVFFVLGYIFYGSMFIALGALAESMQDASTLMTPMVLVLTACILLVPVGISYPDASVLTLAVWFPFSAPFASIIRLASDPPLWETLGSAFVLAAASVFVVAGSSRVFQHGVLTGGGVSVIKNWFMRTVLRTKI